MVDYSKIIVYDDTEKKHVPVTGYLPIDDTLTDDPESLLEYTVNGLTLVSNDLMLVSGPLNFVIGRDAIIVPNNTKTDHQLLVSYYLANDEDNLMIGTTEITGWSIEEVYFEFVYAYSGNAYQVHNQITLPDNVNTIVLASNAYSPESEVDHLQGPNGFSIVDSGLIQTLFETFYVHSGIWSGDYDVQVTDIAPKTNTEYFGNNFNYTYTHSTATRSVWKQGLTTNDLNVARLVNNLRVSCNQIAV